MVEVSRGFYPGRFQPFHLGHASVVRHALDGEKPVDELIISLGSSRRSHQPNYPFTTGERREMIRRALEEMGISTDRFEIMALTDTEDFAPWPQFVRSQARHFGPVFTNSALVGRLFKEDGVHEVRNPPLYAMKNEADRLRATAIRQAIAHGGEWEHMVLPTVAEYIKEIRGDERIRELMNNLNTTSYA